MAYVIKWYRYDVNGRIYSAENLITVEIPASPWADKASMENLFYWNRFGNLSLTYEAKQWIKENVKGGYMFDTTYSNNNYRSARFYFTQEKSAVLFKLRYG